ncbi:MAG: hypothetical protein RQ966_00650 [Acetobacteraceae bacterium]|nr:hypothetical protein [Acetobacteraceae bacterium]
MAATDGSSCLYPPAVFGLLVAIMVVCAAAAVLNDGDTFTHIAAGGWMLEHLAVLRSDPFTSTFAGQPWTAHEWLSEVWFGAAYRVAGLSGVVLLTAAAAAVTFSNLARHVGRLCGWRSTMLLTSGALLCVIPSVLARPHVLALPVLELWVAGLVITRHEGRAPPWPMLLLMVVWANLHGGFAFGIALAAAFAVEAMLAPGREAGLVWRWWGFVAGSAVAAMVTPLGWDGLLFPFRLLQLHSLGFIQEWQPVDFTKQFGFESVVLALVALLGTGRVRLPWLRLLLLLGMLHLTILHARHVPLFGIVGALILAEPIERAFAEPERTRRRRGGMGFYWAGLALVAVLRLALPVQTIDARAMPVSALAQLPPELAGSPMLNSTQFGGYLALSGLRPFVDGRVELFGDAFIGDYMAMARADVGSLRRGVDRYGVTWALLAVDDPLVAGFDGLTGWRRQYADGVAVVFVRS